MDDYFDQLIQEVVMEAAQEATQKTLHSAIVKCLISIMQKGHDVEYAMNEIDISEDEKPLYRTLVDEALQGVAV